MEGVREIEGGSEGGSEGRREGKREGGREGVRESKCAVKLHSLFTFINKERDLVLCNLLIFLS